MITHQTADCTFICSFSHLVNREIYQRLVSSLSNLASVFVSKSYDVLLLGQKVSCFSLISCIEVPKGFPDAFNSHCRSEFLLPLMPVHADRADPFVALVMVQHGVDCGRN